MRNRLLTQVIFTLMTLSLCGQDLYNYKGRVTNPSNEPIIGAQFMIPYTATVVAITGDNGVFDFSVNEAELEIRQIGYEPFLVTPSTGNVVLKEEMSLINAVVVSENKRESQLKNATISMEIISPDLIGNTSPTNLEESIGRINGVQVVDNQPNIRSGSGWSYGAGSRVQVLVDGVPMLSGDAGQPLWTFVPTEGIDGVEIIKGASSVIYGSSALNGVINIKTKEASSIPYTQVSSSFGFYDLPIRESLRYLGNKRNTVSNVTAYHAGIYKGLGVKAGINLLNDESYKMGDYDKRFRGTLGLRKVVADKNLIFGVNSTYQSGTSGSFLLWESYDLGYTALDSSTTDNIVSRISIDPFIKWQKGKFKQTLNTRYLAVNNEVDNGDTAINQSNYSDLIYAEYQSTFSLPKNKFNATAGLVAISSVTESPLYSGNQSANNNAAYIQLDKSWNRLTALAGARYEFFKLNERSEAKPVFRAGLNYKLAQYTFLRGSFGQGYRFPSIAESFISTTVGPISIFPNENLQSETSSNLEFGIKQGLKFKGWQLLLDAAVFRMDYENMMEFTFGIWEFTPPFNFKAGFETLNTGKTRVQGSEFNIAFQKETKNIDFQGFIGATLTESEALDPSNVFGEDSTGQLISYLSTSSDTTGYGLKYRPRNQIKGDVMITYKKWSLGAGIAYQSEMENIDLAFVSVPIDISVPGIQESQDKKLTKATLINTRIGYSFSDKLKMNLILSNITNREYAIRPADLGAPRSVRFQVTYTLDKSK